MAAGHGGSRRGAGRKRKADVFERPIRAAEKKIADHLPRLVENLLALADGVLVEDVNPLTGEPAVYKRPPDRAANEYLINRLMGKPTDRSESEVSLTGGVTIFLPERAAE